MARGTLFTMELVTLIETALEERRHGSVARLASVAQLREGTMHVLTRSSRNVYLPGVSPRPGSQDEAVGGRCRERYHAAVEHRGGAAVSVTDDVAGGAERSWNFGRGGTRT